jgi:hypothetical protein
LFVGSARTTRLFHAIVGLGLTAPSCGGQAATATPDGAQAAVDALSPHDAIADASLDDASASVADVRAEATDEPADAQPDAAIDASPDATSDLDATQMAEVAADVAHEAWHPVPIR